MSLKLLIYDQNCLDLARSMVIKSEILARETEYQLNNALDSLPSDRRTWLYYLNLAGEYHHSNEEMWITSHDTLELIKFSKENLKKHTITKTKYQPTSKLTTELIEKYPNNTALIMGIIYDLDIDYIINAPELSIVAYDSSLVGIQECNLIYDIERAIQRKFGTPLNKDYIDIEPGYLDVFVWKLSQALVFEIKYARLLRHRTTWASSFDMWTYINSRIYLEDLNYALTHNDVVYLYKNIDRLCRDSGSNKVIDELIDHFLSSRGIDTYQLEILRDIKTIDNLDAKYDIRLVENQLNGHNVRDASLQEYERLGRSRSHGEIKDYASQLERRMRHRDDHLPTRELKILEILENSSDTQLLLTDIDLFVQAVGEGVFESYYTITNHLNGDNYRLTATEAIILYMYVVGEKLGKPPVTIGSYDTQVVPLPDRPSATEIVDTYGITEQQALGLLELMPEYPKTKINQAELTAFITSYKDSIPNIRRYLQFITTYDNQVMVAKLENALFCTVSVKLVPEVVNYQDWLASNLINLSAFDSEDWVLFEENILRNIFHLDLAERTSHRSIGVAELIKRFCSYRVNITARADSANLINYFLSPILSKVTVTSEEYLVVDLNAPVELIRSTPNYDIIVSGESSDRPKPPIISESSPLSISYVNSGITSCSRVITPPMDHTSVELSHKIGQIEEEV